MKFVLAALAVLFLTGASEPPAENVGSQEHGGTGYGAQEAQPYQGLTQHAPISVELLNTGKSDKEAAQEANAVDETNKLTLALVFATVLQFIALSYQTYYVRRSVRVAERALTDLERPYVLIERIEVSFHDPRMGAARKPSLAVRFHNYGRTPANLGTGAICSKILDHLPTVKDAIPPDNLTTEQTFSEVEIVIGPDKPWPLFGIDCWDDLGIHEMIAIQNKTKFIYCWGFINYRDIFGNIHPTHFCRRYNYARSEFEPVGGKERNYAN